MKTLLISIVFLLSGCTLLGEITGKAADINDKSLVSAEFVICSAASVGAIERRYNTKELLTARKILCERNVIIIEE